MNSRKAHWDNVYSTKNHQKVSWFQADCKDIAENIASIINDKNAPIIDIGAGASRLIDSLLNRGFTHLTALDIAQPGLNIAKARLSDQANQVQWICADITKVKLPEKYALWHDRAAFHFLTDHTLQQSYVKQLKRSLLPNATVMLATFAINGPEKCSDLTIEQYDDEKLMALLGNDFELINSRQENHTTPAGGNQLFQHFQLRFEVN